MGLEAISHKEIIKRILELIRSGVYRSGSRLPEQKSLAEMLGVSQVKIRDACIALEALGWIERRGRKGTYVVEIDTIQLKRMPKITPLELTEARALFEAESAALAAPIITEETIVELQRYISIMSGVKDPEMTPDEADEAFHNAIAQATHNKMIIFVIESMWNIRAENQELEKVYREVCDSDSAHREKEHLEILEALQKRDPIAARQAMRAHFTTIIEALLTVSEKGAYEEIQLKASENRARFQMASHIVV